MIVALAWLLQSAALAPDSLVVRTGAGDVAVPLVETASGPAVRADLVATPMGGRVRALANGHHSVSFPGVELDVAAQVPFARVGSEVVPLTAAPFVDGGQLYVPLQLVADVVPRYGTGVIYDAERGELRIFGARQGGRGTTARAPDARPAAPVPTSEPRPPAPRAPGGRRRLVVVDAGHGGPDNGMTGPIGAARKIREKDITLAVALRVAELLRARGVEVAMTRTTDTLIALGDRGQIANRQGADLFLSIHVNAANMRWKQPAAARGFETYFLAEAKTEEESRVERMENEAVRFETGFTAAKGDPLSFIMNDMAQNEHLRESSDLAETIQQRLRRMHPGPDRGVKQANFAVLRTSFRPAVLIEIGFGTNPAEAAYISDSERQRQLAASIADATVEYLAHYERRVAGGAR
jgi:N-acetylmuramoyl-L-alanine amidase